MNVKVTVILPLVAIISFISGIHCPRPGKGPRTYENVRFPPLYQLRSCRSDSPNTQLNEPGSKFEIARSERTTGEFCLTQKLSNDTRKYYFKPEDVEFLSMKDAVLTMIIPNNNQNKMTVTCVYPTHAVAQMFYANMTQGRNNLIPSRNANSFKSSNDTELVRLPSMYVDCSGSYIKIVFTNIDRTRVVLIFQANAVSEIKRIGDTGLSAYIRFNSGEPELYKFDFQSARDASEWSNILVRLGEHTGPPHVLAEFAREF